MPEEEKLPLRSLSSQSYGDLEANQYPSWYLKTNAKGKVTHYADESLLSWQALCFTTGTIFFNRRVWIVVPYVWFVMLVSASLVYFGVPNSQRMDTTKFNDFVVYLKVFITFLLGLFLSTAFKRWWASVGSFKHFMTAIKQLMFTLHALNVVDALFDEVKRLTITSCFIMNYEVQMESESSLEKRDELFGKTVDKLQRHGYITPVEREELETSQKKMLGVHSTMIWTWIGEVMTRVKNEPTKFGVKPAPPMYVRLLFLCHDCMRMVEELKTNLTVQVPFSYAHMLAWMIHVANILLAISCGLAMGSAMDEMVARSDVVVGPYDDSGMNEDTDAGGDGGGAAGGYADLLLLQLLRRAVPKRILTQFYGAVQVCTMQLLVATLQPLLYQSFLVIAHSMCYPFGNKMGHMPTESFIQQLQFEMDVMETSAHQKQSEPEEKKKDKEEEEEEDEEGGD